VLNSLKKLKQRQGFVRYLKNTSWLMGERILRMGVGLFVGIWIARYLGPEQFGLLSYAQSFVFLFTAIATLGLDGIVVRELVKDESKRDILLGTAFGLKLIGAIIILPTLYLAVQFTNNDDYTNLLVFIIASATIFQSFNVIDFYYQSKVLSKYVALANAVVLGLSSTIKIVLLLTEAPLLAFAAMVVFDGLVLAIGLVYFYIKTSGFKLSGWVFSGAMAKRLLNDSWPLIFGSMAASIYMQIDQVMIKAMLGNNSAGQYAVAVKLSSMWLFVTTSITSTLRPLIIKAKGQNESFYFRKIEDMYSVLVKISFLISFVVALFSEEIILFLYGGEYFESIDVLRVYVWTIIFVFLSNGSWAYYLNENLQKLASVRLVIGAIVNILLNLYLIKIYGLMGAVYATLISHFISSYFINVVYKKTRKNFMMQTNALINLVKYDSWRSPFILKSDKKT